MRVTNSGALAPLPLNQDVADADGGAKPYRHGDSALNNARFWWSCAKCSNTRKLIGLVINPDKIDAFAARFEGDKHPEITVPRYVLGAVFQPVAIPLSLLVCGEEYVRAGIVKGVHGVGVAVGLGRKGR